MIHCTPLLSNFVLLSVKAIFAVVSGVFEIQTKIFMTGDLVIVRLLVVYATKTKISDEN